MKQKTRSRKRVTSKAILRLPDLEVAKSAVLNSLSCPDAQRGYRHAIDEFVDWYCSEPRLSFSKTVVRPLSDASGVAASSHRARSTFVSEQCVASRTRLRIADS